MLIESSAPSRALRTENLTCDFAIAGGGLAGKQTAHWDGRDREGKPAAPCAYSWKLLTSPGLEAEYLLSIGTSTGYQHWTGIMEELAQ